VTEATSNGTAWSRRVNNSIQYWSPVFAACIQADDGTGELQSPASAFPNGVPKPKEYSGNVTWARGPWRSPSRLIPTKDWSNRAAAGGESEDRGPGRYQWNFGIAEIGAD